MAVISAYSSKLLICKSSFMSTCSDFSKTLIYLRHSEQAPILVLSVLPMDIPSFSALLLFYLKHFLKIKSDTQRAEWKLQRNFSWLNMKIVAYRHALIVF